MDLKSTIVVFGTIFLAELGDKSQLATLLFATKNAIGPTTVFVAASLAVIASTGIAVMVGASLSRYVPANYLQYGAGIGFLLVGFWSIWQASSN